MDFWPITDKETKPHMRGSKKKRPKIKVKSPYSVNVLEGDIGPRHDPYGFSDVIVTHGDKRASYYEDGLGNETLELHEHKGEMEGYQKVFELKWIRVLGGDLEENLRLNRQMFVKMNILFRRHVGVEIEDARTEHEQSYSMTRWATPANTSEGEHHEWNRC